LFSSQGTTSALYKALAIDFKGRLTLGIARDTQKGVVNEFGVDKFPTLVVLPGGEKDGVMYSGELKHDAMFKFLSQYAGSTTAESSSSSTSAPLPPPKKEEPKGMPLREVY